MPEPNRPRVDHDRRSLPHPHPAAAVANKKRNATTRAFSNCSFAWVATPLNSLVSPSFLESTAEIGLLRLPRVLVGAHDVHIPRLDR